MRLNLDLLDMIICFVTAVEVEVNNEETEKEVFQSVKSSPEEVQSQRKSTRIRKAPSRFGEWTNSVREECVPEEPKTVKAAMESEQSEQWLNAMKSEMKSLKKNNVWTLQPLPEGKNVVG